jgi:hypothetical protein
MHKVLILLTLAFFTFNLKAQRWKGERHTVVGSVGMSHFMGDLGGGSKDAAHFFGIRDLDFGATRPAISVSYRFRIIETVAARAGIGWAILAADDALSGSVGRKNRNLHFKSNLFQFHLHGEYYFLKERLNPRYSFSSLHSIRNFSAYVFTGVSVNMFNPKAKLDGTWYELQPLGTEGQGIGDNPAPYSKVAIGWPLGLGVKYSLTSKIAIGLEVSNTYTTSDYIDDASDKYYANDEIAATYGEVAAQLADRHLYNSDGTDATIPYESGTGRRGNPKYNDAFIFTQITVTYKLRRDNRGLPKF